MDSCLTDSEHTEGQLTTKSPRSMQQKQQVKRPKKDFVKSKKMPNLSSRGFQSHRTEGSVTTRSEKAKSAASSSVPKLQLSSTEDEEDVESGSDTSDLNPTPNIQMEKTESTTESISEQLGTKKEAVKKRRYILFVGNLPQTASHEDIVSHFEKRGVRVAEFRLLTHKDTGKSKGCGFLELSSDKMLHGALKFHRTLLGKKHINVEVTCGGGGKSEQRRTKIVHKNRVLRKKQAMVKHIKRVAEE